MLDALWAILLGYMVGSIPTGYLIVKAKTGKDIRTIGSGSTGATNVKRVLGKKWFFTTMFLDGLKGALPVVLTSIFLNNHLNHGLTPVLAAITVLIGHSRSIFLKFTGGKSVAAAAGTIAALNPVAAVSLFVVWCIITWFSRYVSLGSIIAVGLAPFVMAAFKEPAAYIVYCSVGAIYIIWLHRENIKRLINGNENKVR